MSLPWTLIVGTPGTEGCVLDETAAAMPAVSEAGEVGLWPPFKWPGESYESMVKIMRGGQGEGGRLCPGDDGVESLLQ